MHFIAPVAVRRPKCCLGVRNAILQPVLRLVCTFAGRLQKALRCEVCFAGSETLKAARLNVELGECLRSCCWVAGSG